MKVFRFIFARWRAALIILALLFLQGITEMTLPTYMSRLVDVGIQQGGIDSPVARRLGEESYGDLRLLIGDEDRAAFEAAYTLEADGYALKTLPKEQLAALETIVGYPSAMLFRMSQQGPQALQALRSGMLTRQALEDMAQQTLKMQGPVPDVYIGQAAAQFVRAEYGRLGMDLGDIQQRYLWQNGALMLLLTLGMGIAAITSSYVGSRTSARIGRDLRARVFHQVISFSKAEIDRFSTASLITRSGNDIRQIEQASMMTLRMFFYAPIMGIIGIWRVSQLQSGLSWIIVVAVVTATVLVGVLAGRAVPYFQKIQQLVDRQNLVVREILTGLPVIRAFTRERHEEERFSRANLDLLGVIRKVNYLFIVLMPAMFTLMNVTMLAIVWFGAHSIDAGTLQVGSMMAMISYTMYILMAFMMLSMGAVMLPRANVSSQRVLEVLETKSSVVDAKGTAVLPERWRGELRFEGVHFRFPGADAPALEDIDFVAQPGEMTAIIGGTGSGKSTLLNLVPRMYDTTRGRVTIDGLDVRDIPFDTLRGLIGYIPQQAVLFSGDILSNISYGNQALSLDEAQSAAQIAQAAGFIGEKDEGYKAPISRGGTNVSGGQRQRLSIARAIAIKPSILLFDDSFSALDYRTELNLRRALKGQLEHTTVLVVAQRIASVMHADKILVLDNGRIVGRGRHEELMKDNPTYREIAKSQLSEQELQGGMPS